MAFVRPLTLLTTANTKWTTAQEKSIARDYPFTDLHLDTAEQFVVRTYLQFLWLPESIMSISLLIPSLQRVFDVSPQPADTPHTLHTLLEPLLLSVRLVVTKYHTELPEILAQGGGEGEREECMMWYALGYEMIGEIGEESTANSEVLEEKARNMWLERLERREVQIQILLYLLKLSLPGPCAPLPPVTIPMNDVLPSSKKKRKKERTRVVTPSPRERLESFMDTLCTWQLVTNVNTSNKQTPKGEHDWMQTFCEDVVERQFKSRLPDLCALLRHKLFPHSPFSDEEDDMDGPTKPVSKGGRSARSRSLARSSTSTSIVRSKDRPHPKAIQRCPSVQSHTASDARSRSRSLSVSLAQDASARRSNASSGTVSSLKRALSREVSMSRGFKPRAQQRPTRASRTESSGTKVQPKVQPEAKNKEKRSQGVTLVAATPMKRKVREDTRRYGQASNQSRRVSTSFDLEGDDLDSEHGTESDGGLPGVKDETEDLWLPNSSPDILLLGARKRSASGSSSSVGLSDPDEGDTPVRKRPRVL